MTRGCIATLAFGIQGLAKSYILGVARNDAARIYALSVGSEDDVVDGDDVARFEAFDKIGSPGIALRCVATAVEHETVSRDLSVARAIGLGGNFDFICAAGGKFLAVNEFGCHFVAAAGTVALVGAAPITWGVQRQAVVDACTVDAFE